MTFTNPKLAAYHAAMIARKATAAGLSVDAFLARSAREDDRQRAISKLQYSRDAQFAAIARKAAAYGRRWRVAVPAAI